MPASETRTFEFRDEHSHKFWTITLEGSSHTVRFGRIGTEGQEQKKTFPSADAARKSYDKLIAEKLKKGYTEMSGSPLRQALTVLDDYLKQTDAKMFHAMSPGAGEAELAKLSKSVFNGGAVPPGLREWFSWHNGQTGGPELLIDRTFTLLSVDEAIGEWEGMRAVSERWDRDWLPIMSNGGGDFLSFDIESSGIAVYWHDDDADSPRHGGAIGFTDLAELAECALAMRQEAAKGRPRLKVEWNLAEAIEFTEISQQILEGSPRGTTFYGGPISQQSYLVCVRGRSGWVANWFGASLEDAFRQTREIVEANDPNKTRNWHGALHFVERLLQEAPASARRVRARISD